MLLPNCFVDFISLLLSYLVMYGFSMVPHGSPWFPISIPWFLMVPHIYLLVSISMAPHTWSAIQKPVITQTMAVVAPTTNESMHIFKSFLRLIFNLLLSPCITAPVPRKSSVTATAHRPITLLIRHGNGPSLCWPITLSAQRPIVLSTSAHSREKSLLCQGGKLPCYSDALQGPRSFMVKNVG